jgi:transmembrane sensor
MTDDRTPTAAGGAIREEAATWFARMRGPDMATDRPAFDAWLATSPLHRDAYNRIAEVFSMGKALGAAPVERHPVVEPAHSMRTRVQAICAASAILLAGAGGWAWTHQQVAPGTPSIATRAAAPSGLAYATPVGTIRTWRLGDGSRVTLDTDSTLDVAFTPTMRTLRLLRGRARFDVAHEPRPFVVAAGAGTVTAHGTLFDVRLREGGAVSVRLIRGAIDVALPGRPHSTAPLRQRLVPGEQLVFDATALPAPRTVVTPSDARWPDATIDCDRATLGTIVAEANRYSPTQIVVADQALFQLQVSGSFRIDDPEKLAARLGLLFDLAVGRDAAGRVVLSRG